MISHTSFRSERFNAVDAGSYPSFLSRNRGRDAPAISVPPSRAQSPSLDPSRAVSVVEMPADMPPQSVPHHRKPKARNKQSAQKSLDEFWVKFTTSHPGKPYAILPNDLCSARLSRLASTSSTFAPSPTSPHAKNNTSARPALASYDEARAACIAKVEKISKECRRTNQKYRDPHFDIEADFRRWNNESPFADCLMGLLDPPGKGQLRPQSVKRVEDVFENPRFFIEGATASDVRQGKEGDCWFMSALATLSNKEGLIQRVCVARDEDVGVYGFVFHRDGEWISSVIDDKLYLIKEDFHEGTLERNKWLELHSLSSPEEEYRNAMQTGSRALYFAQCSDPNETWLPLLEKAFAKAHGDYGALESGFVGEGIEDLTGGVTTELFSTDILDKEKFWREELLNVNKEFLFGCGQMGGKYGSRNGILEKHAYSIMEAREVQGQRLLKLRNPWGNTEWRGAWSDGSSEWTPEWMKTLEHKFGDDGVFWISYKDLLSNYQHFDRTRLFGPEWTVTQQWTSLTVPWSVDYLDTKFQITLTRPSPVVIVLSQLDDRYFRGLEGQYDFHLQFRLHDDSDPDGDYIVRSNRPYYMKRSVSTELDLEAGSYTVLLKITAKRFPEFPTVEDVVQQTCQFRREKLLSLGLSYDLAHAKGQFRELEREALEREKEERKARKKEHAKRMFEARVKEAKKRKLRALKIEQKKQERAMQKMIRRAEEQKRLEEEEVKRRMEGFHLAEDPEELPNGLGIAVNGGPVGNPDTPPDQPQQGVATASSLQQMFSGVGSPNGQRPNTPPARPGSGPARADTGPGHRRPTSLSMAMAGRPSSPHNTANAKFNFVGGQPLQPSAKRRDTLTVDHPGFGGARPPSRPSTPTPGIRVQRASLTSGKLSLSDVSDDGLSWDSEIDGPSDEEDYLLAQQTAPLMADFGNAFGAHDGAHNAGPKETDDDETAQLAKDPWNAVCVVGLRVYSKDTEVGISVERPGSASSRGARRKSLGRNCVVIEDNGVDDDDDVVAVQQYRALDVDDASKDASGEIVSPVRETAAEATVEGAGLSGHFNREAWLRHGRTF